jgi:hypothetical protein
MSGARVVPLRPDTPASRLERFARRPLQPRRELLLFLAGRLRTVEALDFREHEQLEREGAGDAEGNGVVAGQAVCCDDRPVQSALPAGRRAGSVANAHVDRVAQRVHLEGRLRGRLGGPEHRRQGKRDRDGDQQPGGHRGWDGGHV